MINIDEATVEELEQAYDQGIIRIKQIPEYSIYSAMRRRCKQDPNSPDYKNYAGRGITIYPEWKADFWSWFRHIGRRPVLDGFFMAQDRIDNNDGYRPYNVRWCTSSENNHNKRPGMTALKGEDHYASKNTAEKVRTIRAVYVAGEASQSELAEEYGVSKSEISKIISGERWKEEGYQPIRHEKPPLLTEEQVRGIRAAYAVPGVTQKQVAKEYGVSPTTAANIVSGKTWKHLPEVSRDRLKADLSEAHENLSKQMEMLGY